MTTRMRDAFLSAFICGSETPATLEAIHPQCPRQSRPVKPEIMSPAGYWPQLRAAIEAGADSVYFGLKHFTARAKVGFSLDELPEVMRTLHARGVKGFVTFNTLVFEHELDEAVRAIAAIAKPAPMRSSCRTRASSTSRGRSRPASRFTAAPK